MRITALLVAACLLAAACGDGDGDGTEAAGPDSADVAAVDIQGLVLFEDLSTDHVAGDVTYTTNPPVGGDHNRFWQACGFYSVPVPEERAVHALEHGAVWIAYAPGTDVDGLAALAEGETHLLVSPVDGLQSPVVMAAWGAQLEVDGPDDGRIETFIGAFVRQGPERAGCAAGGVGSPPDDPGPALDS